MSALAILIPVALFLGAVGLAAFFWSLKSNQYDDLEGAAMRILIDDEDVIFPQDNDGDAPSREETPKNH